MSYFNTTLKRNSKLDLSKSDLLKLVSMLEGELQAREIAIAVLKSEQIKRLLNPPKLPLKTSGFKAVKNLNACGSTSTTIDLSNPEQTIKYSADPLSALSRDSFAIYEPSFDYSTTLTLFNLKSYQLENCINSQKTLRNKFCEQLKAAEERYDKVLNDLEDERLQNKKLELKYQDYDRVKLEEEVKALTQSIEDAKSREKQIILSLLSERKHLIIKLIEERHQNEELRQVLSSEKGKIAEMVEGLEDESKRSLQMEADLEKYLTDFDKERNSYKIQLQLSESKNAELQKEIDHLRSTMDRLKINPPPAGTKPVESEVASDSGKWNIGEGVRSSIVTMPVSTKVHSLSSVSTVAHPKASVAQPVTKSTTNTILPPPSIPVPQPKQSQQQQSTATMKKATVGVNSIVAASSVDSAYVISKPLNDSINPGECVEPAKSAEGSKNDHSVKQNIMFYENSASQIISSKPISASAAQPTSTATMRKASAGARVPPPVPPNKPSIKPVLPSQAILHQNKIKDANHLLNKANSQTKGPVSSTLSNASAGISKS